MVSTLARPAAEEHTIELMPGGQADFFLDRARHPGLFGGVGGAKTSSNVIKAFAFCQQYPGARGVLTEPTFPMVRDVLVPSIRELFGSVEGRLWELKTYSGGYTVRFLDSTSEILLRSANLFRPERHSGLQLAFFGMDEIALGDQEAAFKMMQERIRQPGFPNQGWVTGTPKGRNWVWQRWHEHPERSAAYTLHNVRTSDNKYLPPEYITSLRESFGDTAFAQQELEGLFVELEGLIYPQFQTGSGGHVCPPPMRPQLVEAVGGIDIGLQAPSCIEVYARTAGGRVHGLDEFYQRRCPLERLMEAASEFRQKWNVRRFFIDPHAKEEREFMARAGLPVSAAPITDLKVGIQLLGRLLAKQHDGTFGIYFSSIQANLIAEFYTYHWKKRTLGAESYIDEPVDEDNHAQDATRYALVGLMGMRRGRPGQVQLRRV